MRKKGVSVSCFRTFQGAENNFVLSKRYPIGFEMTEKNKQTNKQTNNLVVITVEISNNLRYIVLKF